MLRWLSLLCWLFVINANQIVGENIFYTHPRQLSYIYSSIANTFNRTVELK